jgi:hypothetical protein
MVLYSIYTVPTFFNQGSPFDGVMAPFPSSELQDRTMFDKEINLEWVRKKVMCTFNPCWDQWLCFPSDIRDLNISPKPPLSNLEVELHMKNHAQVFSIVNPCSGYVLRSEWSQLMFLIEKH